MQNLIENKREIHSCTFVLQLITFGVYLLLTSISLQGQSLAQLPIEQVNNQTFKRYNYNSQSALINSQVFQIGQLIQNTSGYYLPIRIYFYNEKSHLTDSLKTRFYCNPEDQKMILNLVPFSPNQASNKVKIKALNGKGLYPVDPSSTKGIPDRKFKLKVIGGWMSLLGSNSVIHIYNRQVVHIGKDPQKWYKMTSKVTLNTYVWGMNFHEVHYSLTEWLYASGTLIKQIFKKEDNSYFIIKRIKQSDTNGT